MLISHSVIHRIVRHDVILSFESFSLLFLFDSCQLSFFNTFPTDGRAMICRSGLPKVHDRVIYLSDCYPRDRILDLFSRIPKYHGVYGGCTRIKMWPLVVASLARSRPAPAFMEAGSTISITNGRRSTLSTIITTTDECGSKE